MTMLLRRIWWALRRRCRHCGAPRVVLPRNSADYYSARGHRRRECRDCAKRLTHLAIYGAVR